MKENKKGFNYFFSKLFNINYLISIHEGNANRRLASMTPQILFQLAPYRKMIPNQYKEIFNKLLDLTDITLKESDGRLPVRMKGIQNRTAAMYIKALIDAERSLEDGYDK